MRNLRTKLATSFIIVAMILSGCASLPTEGSWQANPQTGEIVITTSPWDGAAEATVAPAPVTSAPVAAPATGNGLRYDNAGQQYDDGRFDTGCVYPGVGLATGQTATVAYLICSAASPTDAWVAIQTQASGASATAITADSGTELTQVLPLGTAWVVWQSTCSLDPTKVDLSVPSRDLSGTGCIGFMPPYGAGNRTINFEQAIAVH